MDNELLRIYDQTVGDKWPAGIREDLAANRALCSHAFEPDTVPPLPAVFRALAETPLSETKVVLIGQDPYPTPGVANGFAFAVSPGCRTPASLKNLLSECVDDVGSAPDTDLASWAATGVLLLNTCLTTRERQPLAHSGIGWQAFTGAVLSAIATQSHAIFLCLGKHAERAAIEVGVSPARMVVRSHPSNVGGAFRINLKGTMPFSAVNAALAPTGGFVEFGAVAARK